MLPRSHRIPLLLSALAVTGLAGLFLAQLAALIEHRIDYPIHDDWRYYVRGFAMPEAFSVRWLLQPARDTVHATGKLLDWITFHGVAHDYRTLAASSFALWAGGWLVCGIALCLRATRDRPALRILALLAFVLPLAANPYWVTTSQLQWLEPAIAYHQMLPLTGLFALACLAASDARRVPGAARPALAAAATVFFGLAYASGALSLAVFGAVLCIGGALGRRGPARGDPLVQLGAVVVAAAALCLALHVLMPSQVYGANPLVRARDHVLTPPWESRYWHFLIALFDRAVLSTRVDGAWLLRGGAVALGFVLPTAALAALVAAGRIGEGDRSVAVALVAVVTSVLAYALLVAYGRASFGAFYFPIETAPDVRARFYAHTRFFYWWLAAVLPLVALLWGLATEPWLSRRGSAWVVGALLLAALWPKGAPLDGEAGFLAAWNFDARYARDADEVLDDIRVDRARLLDAKTRHLRVRQWDALPEEVRSKRYRPVFPHGRRAAIRAARVRARFVERWSLTIPQRGVSDPLRLGPARGQR